MERFRKTEQHEDHLGMQADHHVVTESVDLSRLKSGRESIIKTVPRALVGVWWIVEVAVSVALMIFIFRTFIFQTYEVIGQSMSPTLSQNDRLIVFKLGKVTSNLFGDYVPKRGEIIVFDSPGQQQEDSKLQLVKRVIGLPGERVVIQSGNVTIFNDENPEGFDPDMNINGELNTPKTGNVDITVPEGELFVAGDNRAPGRSLDSRNDLGTVPVENVIGDLVFRHLPLSEAQTF